MTIKGPKTASGVRDIPIHSKLLPKLLEAKGDLFAPVFPNAKGGRMDDDTMYRRWRSFCRELDIYMGAKVYRNQIIESKLSDDLTPVSYTQLDVYKRQPRGPYFQTGYRPA